VVLSNDDLVRLGKQIEIGHTPVIITNQMIWNSDSDLAERNELLKSLEQWRSDWSSLNTEAYLSHYAQDFSAAGIPLSTFAQQKRLVNSGKSWIKVKVSSLSLFPYPNQPNLVVVNFEQDYDSNNLSNRMKKRQYWIKRDNRWQIIYEGAAS
jgi:histidinol-phosphate/aromatic aminotransferase/cobyric acid decarboxylase-like protein